MDQTFDNDRIIKINIEEEMKVLFLMFAMDSNLFTAVFSTV